MHRKSLLSLFMLSMGVALVVATTVVGAASAKSAGNNILTVTQAGGAFDTLDPQLSYVSNDWGLLYNTELTLLNFPTKAGTAGNQLIPQAAASFPNITNNGKTYVFHIRAGLKLSNGEAVNGLNFERAFERNISPKMYAPYGVYDGLDVWLVGGQAFAETGPYSHASNGGCGSGAGSKCTMNPPSHISGISVGGSGNLTLTIKLTKVVPQFESVMGMPWFQAVPKLMPYTTSPGGILKYASGGPYFIYSNNLTSLTVLHQNKNWPSSTYFNSNWPSNPLQIVIKTYPNSNGTNQVLQAEANQVDLAGVPSQEAAKVIAHYNTRFVYGATTCINWLAMNNAAKNGTTNHLSVRKALNQYLSRNYILSLAGPKAGVASDNILVPQVPGYHANNVYPANGSSVSAAKSTGGAALQGAPLNIYDNPSSNFSKNVAAYIQQSAAQLGMGTATIQDGDPNHWYRALMTKATAQGTGGYNITTGGGWCADYADGYDYINVNFDGRTIGDTGNTDYMYFNNKTFNTAMDSAAATTGKTARATAYRNLDLNFMKNYAPIAPTFISNNRYITSIRAHNVIYSTWWGQPYWNAIKLS